MLNFCVVNDIYIDKKILKTRSESQQKGSYRIFLYMLPQTEEEEDEEEGERRCLSSC